MAWQAATIAAVLRDEGSNVRRSYVRSPDGFVDASHGYHIRRVSEVTVLLRDRKFLNRCNKDTRNSQATFCHYIINDATVLQYICWINLWASVVYDIKFVKFCRI